MVVIDNIIPIIYYEENKIMEEYYETKNYRSINIKYTYTTRKLKVSCLCSQLSFIFGHPIPATSMYFALFPYFFPCEESIREKVFFSS